MTQHTHREYVPGCYRCDLNRDEEEDVEVELIRCTPQTVYWLTCTRCGFETMNSSRMDSHDCETGSA